MGTNRRYAEQLDRGMDDRILERTVETGALQSLTPQELELDRLPLTVDPTPRRVRAWVHFDAVAVRVEAEVLRWTPRAIGIRFVVDGREMKTWVWASAVERIPEESD